MGGSVDCTRVDSLDTDLPTSELKQLLQSNVIPLALIQTGTFYHRALLFKVAAGYFDGV